MQTQTECSILVLYTDGKILTGLRKLLDRENIHAIFLTSELFYDEIQKTLKEFCFGAVIVDELFRKYLGLATLRKMLPGSEIFLMRAHKNNEANMITIVHFEGFTEDAYFDCANRSQRGLFIFALKHSIVNKGTATSEPSPNIFHAG